MFAGRLILSELHTFWASWTVKIKNDFYFLLNYFYIKKSLAALSLTLKGTNY